MRGLRNPFAGCLVLASMVLLTACTRNSDINQAYLRSDGMTIELEVDTCNAELVTSVVESATTVQVTVTARNDTTDDCLDLIVITLEEPLEDRTLVDGSSGAVFDVRPAEG